MSSAVGAPPQIGTVSPLPSTNLIAPLPPPPVMKPVSISPVELIKSAEEGTSTGALSAELSETASAVGNEVDPINIGYDYTRNEGPPPALPIATFASRTLQVLARRQTHIPILIIATEASNRIAWKNKLRLHDMFQGLLQDVRPTQQLPPFRSIHKSLTLTGSQLQVQFMEGSMLSPYSFEDAHDMLQQNALLQEADGNLDQELVLLEDRVDELLQDSISQGEESLEKITKDAFALTSPLDIPWLLRYRHALDVSTNSLPHDLINCPPLLLLVCTTQEVTSPAECLQELASSPRYLPSGFANGLYDPQSMRQEVLVLHDNVDGPLDWDETVLRQSLQRQFGKNSGILRINSVLPETADALAEQETTDLWGGKGQKGNFLSVNDRVVLRRYFNTLITSSLLPALERRISDLNAIVSERKKGVRNVLKSFWRKPKDETPETISHTGQNSAKYRFDSIESQTRLLADTLFLMRDYDAALGIYRLIRDDYKSDKAMVYYANVQEMMALCLYQIDPYGRSKEIFSHLETALFSYTRAAEEERQQLVSSESSRPSTAPHSTRLATRLCLLITSTQNITTGRELEVADLLASASSHETSLGAAVLLEQSSAFYFKAAMYRKYAFHMLMSGHMFRSASQEHHAFRCFTSALYVYRHGKWKELHDHLRSALAAQLYTMGRMSVSLQLYAKLVGTASGGKVSVKSQQKFLGHLLEICRDHRKKALAGADRMAAPASLTGAERERVRKVQLERIVQVIRFTKGASRVLELPHMNLPCVHDKTVKVWTNSEHFHDTEDDNDEEISPATFGSPAKGGDAVWDELIMTATAELKSVDSSKPNLDETVTAVLSKIEDPDTRRVIAQIDKQKANRNLLERSKRSGTFKETPAVRSRREPLFVDFVIENPLSVDIDVSEVQLVARMIGGERVCTNQDAITILPLNPKADRQWKFPSTNAVFEVAHFCRISEGPADETSRTNSWKAAEDEAEEPFFVVTKTKYNLPPGGETRVSAGICPLILGELEILGVRCRLFDTVWVFHPFDIKGPLLQNSRTNDVSRGKLEVGLVRNVYLHSCLILPCRF
jgi:tetratricopeptide (TPR) repeat protein